MAASTTQNPVSKGESKSAKKKKAKAEASIETPAPAAEVAQSNNPADSNNGDGTYESPYIKELYKNIRNVNKKITNASKVDDILAENPGKSLDELVAARKINKDQQAQILKKPALQASLTQLEEQIAQYKKFDSEYKAKAQAEKVEYEKALTERTSKELEEAVTAAKEEARATAVKEQEDALLLLSQFLRLAAIRRSEEATAEKEDSRATEGLLAVVYAGNSKAVKAMINLIQGSTAIVKSVDDEPTSVTFADIKNAALAQPSIPEEAEEPITAASATTTETSEHEIQSDPTIANAGLTELDEPSATTAVINGDEAFGAAGIPQNSGFGDGAANAAAEANWDNANDLSASQEWVEVPRDAAETDTGLTATPAAPANVQSWADDQPESPPKDSTQTPAQNNDGFHEVQRNRGQNRGGQGGQYRGRGQRGGEGRGRGGFRGDGRGRGRGGNGPRGGPRRPEAS